ncbi:HNH/ENDO VII family nuclease [Chryseobacterium sp. M5A1_1a]
MGNKIITEKDFWKCSSGAAFAQLQGTRTSNKKNSGEVYITVADTSTSSWIDFGCTKNTLLAAIVGAVVAIVVVVAVVAFVVGTGGLGAIALIGIGGMMAIGAAGGVAGGLIMAAKGALDCGHKNAGARTWDASKDNLILTGTPAITGNRTMTCSVGGVVKFAPEVKSWMHALALSGFNYVTELAGCALGGAGVGALVFAGAGVAGGSLAVGWPTLPSVLTNVGQGFTGIWGSSRVLFGLNNLANEDALGNVKNEDDSDQAMLDGAVPEIGMAQRIFTGQAQPTDYMLFLYLLNIKGKSGKPPVEEPNTSGDKDGNNNSKGNQEEANNKAPEDDGAAGGSKGKGESDGKSKGGKEADAFEDPPKFSGKRPANPEQPVIDADGNLTDYGKWYYERPAWKGKTIDDVWSNAKNTDGKVIDRQSKSEITWDKTKPRGEQWHMGHKEGYEFNKHQKSSAERGIGVDQFRKEYNTAGHVEPELPKSNLSHKGEAPKDVYYGF